MNPEKSYLALRNACFKSKTAKPAFCRWVVVSPRAVQEQLLTLENSQSLYQWGKEKFVLTCTFFQFVTYQRRAEEILERASQGKIRVLFPWYDDFPAQLLRIADPPTQLFVKGNVSLLHSERIMAVVGTRKPSAIGNDYGRQLAQNLVRENFVVVSGLALGCDTVAHQGALSSDGKTIAVMAHGLDSVYPPSNAGLASEILQKHGCLVSEYPPGVQPEKFRFVARNRIQSGLSRGVIIVESAAEGGTMHTARACIAQERKLACMAHFDRVPKKSALAGNRKLIDERNAFPLPEPKDVISFLQNECLVAQRPITAFFAKRESVPLEGALLSIRAQKNRLAALYRLLGKEKDVGKKRKHRVSIAEVEAKIKALQEKAPEDKQAISKVQEQEAASHQSKRPRFMRGSSFGP